MAPGNETVSVLARVFNVTEATLYAWRRVALKGGVAVTGDGRNAEQWSGPAKFAAPLQAGMPGDLDTGFDGDFFGHHPIGRSQSLRFVEEV